MFEQLFPIHNLITLELPSGFFGWLWWFLLLGVIIVLNRRWWAFNQPFNRWRIRLFIFLILSVPVTTLLIPSYQLSIAYSGPGVPILAALPWFIAAGFMGPVWAAVLGLISGSFLLLTGEYNFFFPLEITLFATWLGWMMYQEYRTPLFRGLRHPIVASIMISLIYPFFHFIDSLFIIHNSIFNRIEYAVNLIFPAVIAFSLSAVLAGIISEVISLRLKPHWGAQRALRPSPGESRLTSRFLFSVVPLSLFLLAILIVGDWIVASRAAQEMLAGRMSNAGEMTAESLPFFLESGQNLILRMAKETDFDRSPDQIQELLSQEIREVPYFNQLIFVDPEGMLIANEPLDAINSPDLSEDEIEAINLASIVPIQVETTGPDEGGEAALVSFIVGVKDRDGDLLGVLIGRNDLAKNPFTKPLLVSIGSLAEIDGVGMLVDENGVILYHPDANRVMTQYKGFLGTETKFYENVSSEGIREFIYYRPTAGKSWSVIITVPSQYAQQQAINIAIPLLGMITLLSVAAIFIFRFGLIAITYSLNKLAMEADRMSQGHLDSPLPAEGEDEVGQLGKAFEKMRTSLKSRLDELNRLLVVSQGIASAFEIEDSLKPVLEAALVTGASSARVYLVPSVVPSFKYEGSLSNSFGVGPLKDEYAYLDEQVVALAKQQKVVKLTNITRPRIFSFAEDSIRPHAIMAVALRHENIFFGTLWIAFDSPHQFADEEIRYIITLAGQAALATANARLYLTSEFGRQRLETILTSTPDPVLVTDQDDNLILTNPAAQKVFHLHDEAIIGKNIADVVSQDQLSVLLSSIDSHQDVRELSFHNGKTYLVTSSTIQSEGSRIGRVYILRDVTSFKQLDALKSEFVSTVSHDLRSPLALIQGYTSMVKIVGELNDQQSSYLKKISSETEKISHLVKNLLDLGRIEAGVGLQLEKKPIDEVVHHVVTALKAQADQKRVQLNVETSQTPMGIIEADQALLEQAIYNLVENAIKYTDSGGEVRVNIRVEDENVIYAVQDNGIGISPADQQNLFEKFYRISNKGKKEDDGSGLGLAIVKSIADRHGGEVIVESQLGVGSSFCLVIPTKQVKSDSKLIK